MTQNMCKALCQGNHLHDHRDTHFAGIADFTRSEDDLTLRLRVAIVQSTESLKFNQNVNLIASCTSTRRHLQATLSGGALSAVRAQCNYLGVWP